MSELERVLHEAEDYLRRNMRSRTSREAQKRRAKRRLHEALRRLKRAGFILVALFAILIAWSLIVAPVGFLTWIVAAPTIFLFAFLTLFWGQKAPEPTESREAIPLATLAVRVEDGLIERARELPGTALPAADRIIARLNELQPHLAVLKPDDLVAGEARRLVGQHLPQLVDAYLDLPESARAPRSEASRKFTDSMHTVADELDHLFERCCSDRHLVFDTQSRFIESRYREDERLKRGS